MVLKNDELLSVAIDSKYIYISLSIFKQLFEGSSHVYYLTDYQRAVTERKIKINKLIELARKAQIPYSLFLLQRSWLMQILSVMSNCFSRV